MFYKKKKKNSMLIGAIAGLGAFAAVTATAAKVSSVMKRKMASEFEHYYCCDDEGNEENIYTYDEEPIENRYQDTLIHRRDRVNKRRPTGIKGEKYF